MIVVAEPAGDWVSSAYRVGGALRQRREKNLNCFDNLVSLPAQENPVSVLLLEVGLLGRW